LVEYVFILVEIHFVHAILASIVVMKLTYLKETWPS